MLVDNLGWGDLGCYGGSAPTPRLDTLAAEGMRFKNYNVENQGTPAATRTPASASGGQRSIH